MMDSTSGGTMDEQQLHELLMEYGDFSLSYTTLDERLERFTMDGVEGYIAYKVSGKTLIAVAQPVCDPKDIYAMVCGFREFGQKQKKRTVFFGTGEAQQEIMRNTGYNSAKAAIDSALGVKNFTTSGNKMENVRRGYKKGVKAGLEFIEHDLTFNGNVKSECEQIYDKWLTAKDTPAIEFIFGHLDWPHKWGKRCFLARSAERIEGFLVYETVPASGRWYLDLSPSRSDAVQGTMDFLMVESIEQFKKEGVDVIYTGMVPNMGFADEVEDVTLPVKRALDHIVANFDRYYPVSSEKFFKNKYRPLWEPLYFHWQGQIGTTLAVDMYRAFQPGGLKGVLNLFK